VSSAAKMPLSSYFELNFSIWDCVFTAFVVLTRSFKRRCDPVLLGSALYEGYHHLYMIVSFGRVFGSVIALYIKRCESLFRDPSSKTAVECIFQSSKFSCL
jgi:hypothetical protein